MSRPIPPSRLQRVTAPAEPPRSTGERPPSAEELETHRVVERIVGPEASHLYDFRPQRDITTYELALLLQWSEMTCRHEAYQTLPETLRRHFQGRPRDSEPSLRRT